MKLLSTSYLLFKKQNLIEDGKSGNLLAPNMQDNSILTVTSAIDKASDRYFFNY